MSGYHWTAKEHELLQQQLREGRLPDELLIPGRTKHSARRKASRLKLIGDGLSRKPWSDIEKEELEGYLEAGWTTKDFVRARELGIPVLMNRTRNAIQKQIQRMNLGNARRSRIGKRAYRFSDFERELLDTFLLEHHKNRSPEQLMKRWNKLHSPRVNISRVRRSLARLKLKSSWKEAIAIRGSKWKRGKKKRQAAARKSWAKFRERQRKILLEAMEELKREAELYGRELALKTCHRLVGEMELGCNIAWPHRELFFRRWRKTTKREGIKFQYSSLCRLCENKLKRRG